MKYINTDEGFNGAEISFIEEELIKKCNSIKEKALAIGKAYAGDCQEFIPNEYENGSEIPQKNETVIVGKDVYHVNMKSKSRDGFTPTQVSYWLDFVGSIENRE